MKLGGEPVGRSLPRSKRTVRKKGAQIDHRGTGRKANGDLRGTGRATRTSSALGTTSVGRALPASKGNVAKRLIADKPAQKVSATPRIVRKPAGKGVVLGVEVARREAAKGEKGGGAPKTVAERSFRGHAGTKPRYGKAPSKDAPKDGEAGHHRSVEEGVNNFGKEAKDSVTGVPKTFETGALVLEGAAHKYLGLDHTVERPLIPSDKPNKARTKTADGRSIRKVNAVPKGQKTPVPRGSQGRPTLMVDESALEKKRTIKARDQAFESTRKGISDGFIGQGVRTGTELAQAGDAWSRGDSKGAQKHLKNAGSRLNKTADAAYHQPLGALTTFLGAGKVLGTAAGIAGRAGATLKHLPKGRDVRKKNPAAEDVTVKTRKPVTKDESRARPEPRPRAEKPQTDSRQFVSGKEGVAPRGPDAKAPKSRKAAVKEHKALVKDAQLRQRSELDNAPAKYSKGFYVRQVQKAADRIAPRLTGESRRVESRFAAKRRQKALVVAVDAEEQVGERVREADVADAYKGGAKTSQLKPARRKRSKAAINEALAGLAQGNRPLMEAIIRDSGTGRGDATVRELATNRQLAGRRAAESRALLNDHEVQGEPRTGAWREERRKLRAAVKRDEQALGTVDAVVKAVRSGRVKPDHRHESFANEMGKIHAESDARQNAAGLFPDSAHASEGAMAGRPVGSTEANIKAAIASGVAQRKGHKTPLQLETTTGGGRTDTPDVPVSSGAADSTRRRTARRKPDAPAAVPAVASGGRSVDLEGVPHPDRSGEAKAKGATPPRSTDVPQAKADAPQSRPANADLTSPQGVQDANDRIDNLQGKRKITGGRYPVDPEKRKMQLAKDEADAARAAEDAADAANARWEPDQLDLHPADRRAGLEAAAGAMGREAHAEKMRKVDAGLAEQDARNATPGFVEPPAPKPGGVVASVDDILLLGESRHLNRRLNEGTITPEGRARLDVVDEQLDAVMRDNPDSLRRHIILSSRKPSSKEHPNPAYDRVVPALDEQRFVDGDAGVRRKLATAIAKAEEANWRSQKRKRGVLQTFDPSVVRTSGETPTIVTAKASEGDIVYVGRGIEGKEGAVRPFAGGDSSARGFWGNPYQAAGQTSNPSPWVVTVATTSEAVKRYKVLLDKNIAAGKVTPEDLAALEGKQLGVPYPVPEDPLTHASVIRDAVAENAARRQAEQGAPERTVTPEGDLATDEVVADMDAALSDEARARRAKAMGMDESSKGPKGPELMSRTVYGAAQRGGRTKDLVPMYRDADGADVDPKRAGDAGVRRKLDWAKAEDAGIEPAIDRLLKELGDAESSLDVKAIVRDIADGVREGFRRELADPERAPRLTRPESTRDTPGNISGYVTPGEAASALRNPFSTQAEHARTGPHAVVPNNPVQKEAYLRTTITLGGDPDTLRFLASHDPQDLHIRRGDPARSHLAEAKVLVVLAKAYQRHGKGLTFEEFAAGARTQLPEAGRDMSKPRHVIITGMREFNQRSVVVAAINELPMGTTVHHGGAAGADRIAGEAAEARGLKVVVHEADWNGVEVEQAVALQDWKASVASAKAAGNPPPAKPRIPSAGTQRNVRMIDAAHEQAAADGQNVEMLSFHTLGAKVRQPGKVGRGTRHAVRTMAKRDRGSERTIAYGLNGPVDRRGQTQGNAIADAVEGELDLQRQAKRDRAMHALMAKPAEGKRTRRLPPKSRHEAGQRAIDKKIADELNSDSPLADPVSFLVDMEDDIKGAEREFDGGAPIDETGADNYDPSVMDETDFGDNLPADFMDAEHDYGDMAPPGQDVPDSGPNDFPSDESFIDPARTTDKQKDNAFRDLSEELRGAEYGERASPGLQGKPIFTAKPGTSESRKEVDRFYYESQTGDYHAILPHRPTTRGRGTSEASDPGIGTKTGYESDIGIPGGLRGLLDTVRKHNRRINRKQFFIGVMQVVAHHFERSDGHFDSAGNPSTVAHKRLVQGGDVKPMLVEEANAIVREHSRPGNRLVRIDYGKVKSADGEEWLTTSYVVPEWVKRYIDMKYAEPGQLRTALRAFHSVFIHSVLPLSLGWQLLNPFDHLYRTVGLMDRSAFGVRAAGKTERAIADRLEARAREGRNAGLYETFGAGSGTHAGAQRKGGEALQADMKGGLKNPVSATLNLAGKPGALVGNPVAKLTDAGLNLAGHIDHWFATPNRRMAFVEWAREMGIDHKRMQSDLRYQNALIDKMQSDPSVLRTLQDKQLEMIGSYGRRTSFEARATEWVPFYTWLRETTKFLFKTLPQRSPMRTLLLLQTISWTLPYRASQGQSDYFSRATYDEAGIQKKSRREMNEVRILGYNFPFANATGLTTATGLVADLGGLIAGEDQHLLTNMLPGVTRPVYQAFVNPDDPSVSSSPEGVQKQWYMLMKGLLQGQGGPILSAAVGVYDPKGPTGGFRLQKDEVHYENNDKITKRVSAEPWLRKDAKTSVMPTALDRLGGLVKAPGGGTFPQARLKPGDPGYLRQQAALKMNLGGKGPLERYFLQQDGMSVRQSEKYQQMPDPEIYRMKPWMNPLQPTYDPNGAKFQSKPDVRQAGAAPVALKGGPKGPAFAEKLISAASIEYGVDAALIRAVMRAESDFQPGAGSSAGAKGLMQLMDFNAKGIDINDNHDNVFRGVSMLHDLLKKYKGNIPLALAGYNAGEGAVAQAGNKVPQIAETQAYVRNITAELGGVTQMGAGAIAASAGPKGSPAQIINSVVLRDAAAVGIKRTQKENDEANDAHSYLTSAGYPSDHKGPGNVAWAADMSNGSSPTPQMAALAARLAKRFHIPWTGSGLVNHTEGGYRYQLIYKAPDGSHYDHVHLGIKLADPSTAGADYVQTGGGPAGDYLATSGGAAASDTTGNYTPHDIAAAADSGSTGGTPIMDALESGGMDALMAALRKKRRPQ